MKLKMIVALVGVAMLAGCSQYAITGKVIEGPHSMVLVVNRDDARLTQHGLPGALVRVMLDPNTLHPKEVGADVADLQGDFHIPVDAFGAGTLNYTTMVTVHLAGHDPTRQIVKLPGRDKAVLVMMQPGQDKPDPQSIVNETMQQGQMLMGR